MPQQKPKLTDDHKPHFTSAVKSNSNHAMSDEQADAAWTSFLAALDSAE